MLSLSLLTLAIASFAPENKKGCLAALKVQCGNPLPDKTECLACITAHGVPGECTKKRAAKICDGSAPSPPVPPPGPPPAPTLFAVKFYTDIGAKAGTSDGTFVINVNRTLAPLGADRFYALVNDGFYNMSAFFRVVPNFVLQFGIAGTPAENEKWGHKSILDDPVLGSNTEGTVTYAMAGPDTRTTELFINFGDNSNLDSQGFAPFGSVSSGLEVAEAAFNPTPGDSGGVDQGDYTSKGNAWINSTYPGINFILSAAVVPSRGSGSGRVEVL